MGSSSRDGRMTATQEDQQMVECQVMNIYHQVFTLPPAAQMQWFEVHRNEHIEFLTKSLTQLGPSSVLDANRPWLCYWILHSIALLRDAVDDDIESNAIDFLNRCQHQNGGFGGGPGQLPHLAITYAAVNSLITLGGERSLSSINRNNLHAFLLRMKEKNGGFRMHDGGEIDVRACYTAISVASILNILDDDLVQNVGSYILSCQTYEGGIGGEPDSEAHGGYTYCGLATMILINEVNLLDLDSLTDWVVCRQGMEGGFQGRTNKLVDGCYSFWQGQVAILVQRLVSIVHKEQEISDVEEEDHCADSCQSSTELGRGEQCLDGALVDDPCCSEEATGQQSPSKQVIRLFGIVSDCTRGHAEAEPFFHSIALQQYILLCSQAAGGFRDKPGKPRDHYHTCYCLSGLSVCQYSRSDGVESPPLPAAVLGPYSCNLLEPTHPLFNVVFERYREAQEFFSASPSAILSL